MLDEEGYFYNTQYDLQAGTGLGEKAQRTAINNLSVSMRYFNVDVNFELGR